MRSRNPLTSVRLLPSLGFRAVETDANGTALAVACRDVDVRNVKAIIIGPPDTPYEFGFFEVG